uniref:GATA-type domain-containing protein n=1 Tax=Meloidogyne enterolobii TaxID=390850 RepID=A0A6V7VFP3_MELEN|nr:unnamed protein product [Meloidogyne enterolobii]
MFSKFIILLLHLIILLNTQCAGKQIPIEVKIKEDWLGKREFIYLKNVEQKERFVLKKIEKANNNYCSLKYNIKDFLCPINFDFDKNTFDTSISNRSRYSPFVQLKRKIVIEIANNQIIQNLLPEFEKRMLRNNNFDKTNNKCYETCILDENLENIKNFKDLNSIKENYENKLLSSYWSEINLIAYKIELLKKQKVEYSKGENKRIVYIGNKINEIIEGEGRYCFNCGEKQTIQWYNYLNEQNLCKLCFTAFTYRNDNNGKFRPKESWTKNKKQIPIKQNRQCYICGSTKLVNYRDSESGNHLCTSCYKKQHHKKKKDKI